MPYGQVCVSPVADDDWAFLVQPKRIRLQIAPRGILDSRAWIPVRPAPAPRPLPLAHTLGIFPPYHTRAISEERRQGLQAGRAVAISRFAS